MKFNPVVSARAIASAVLAVSILAPLAQSDSEFIGIFKRQIYLQDNPVGPRLFTFFEEDPLVFDAFIETDSPGSITSATVQRLPNGPVLNMEEDDGEWELEREFDSVIEFDEEFPPGDYRLAMQTASGERSVVLSLTSAPFPSIPRLRDFSELGDVDTGAALPLEWDAFEGGTSGDFIFVEIEDDVSHELVFETGEPGTIDGLDGTDTTVTIPAGVLAPGRHYHGLLVFVRITDSSTDPEALIGYIRETEFVLRTRGVDVDDTQAPWLQVAFPWDQAADVSRNSAVRFQFSEPMDMSLDVAGSIEWSGAGGVSFTYSWNEQGQWLFAIPNETLPAGAEISWTLNAEETSRNLRDLNGNQLPSNTGRFHTSQNDPPSLDVVEVRLIKGRQFHQSGTSVDEDGSYYLALEIDLTGFNTVTNATWQTPDGIIQLQGAIEAHEIDFEVEYTSETDLDRFFPSGEGVVYTVTLNTVHDGLKLIQLSFGGADFPVAPRVENAENLQAIDPSEAVTIQLSSFTNGTEDDVIFMEIEKDSNVGFNEVWFYEGPGNETSVEVGAPTFLPGRSYELNTGFAKIAGHDEAGYPGVTVVAAVVSESELEIQAVGEIIRPELEITGVDGAQVALRLKGERDTQYTIESSQDLSGGNWMAITHFLWLGNPVATNQFMMEGEFSDFSATGDQRFYRARESTMSDGGNDGGPGPGGGDPVWSVLFSPSFEVTACYGGEVTYFGSQVVLPQGAGGAFDGFWPTAQDAAIRTVGTLTAGGFAADLTCWPSGSDFTQLSAEWEGDYLKGEFNVAGQTGVFFVVLPGDFVAIQGRVVNQQDQPLAGAIISASVDNHEQSAVTDAHGAFYLKTGSPANFASTPYTIRMQVGSDVYEGTHVWGDHPNGLYLKNEPGLAVGPGN